MFAAIVPISTYTAITASASTASRLKTCVARRDDLPAVRVGVVADTTGEQYIVSCGGGFRRYGDAQQTLSGLRSDQVDAVVHDAPILRYIVHRKRWRNVHVLRQTFEPQQYAIALPTGSLLTESVNRGILCHTEKAQWSAAVERHLGRD